MVMEEGIVNCGDLLAKPTAVVCPTILEKEAEELLLRAAYENNSAVAEEALACGTDPNCWDSNGLTPLHIAAARGNHIVVRLLQGNGAIVNSRAFGGFTPLHMAAFSGSFDCTLLLLDGRADPNLRDIYSLTPLEVATQLEHLEVASLIESRGSND